MIVDRLNQSQRYIALHPCFASAFDFLLSGGWKGLEPGRYQLDEDHLIAIVDSAEGRGREAAPLEVHQRYIDIQFVVEGVDEMGWQSAEQCSLPKSTFSEEGDIGFFSDAPAFFISVPAGSFAVFFPEDAHAPLAGVGKVRKVIIKVEVLEASTASLEESAPRKE